MGYQEDCEAYALYGDPERDHWDHEQAAQYDRFDGFGDPDPCDDPYRDEDPGPAPVVEPDPPVVVDDDDVPF